MDGEFCRLVESRKQELHHFLNWAAGCELSGRSLFLKNRGDINDAREAVILYRPWSWWGLIVFSCFGSLDSARRLREVLFQPSTPAEAKDMMESIMYSPGKTVGHHRIRPGLVGAKKAILSACDHKDLFYEVLIKTDSFDQAYNKLRNANRMRLIPQWGRTTSFDLLIRAGCLSSEIGGFYFSPEFAYLAGSSGPKKGFEKVWGIQVGNANASKCENILQIWHSYWLQICEQVFAKWPSQLPPYESGDLENALCIYNERH